MHLNNHTESVSLHILFQAKLSDHISAVSCIESMCQLFQKIKFQGGEPFGEHARLGGWTPEP